MVGSDDSFPFELVPFSGDIRWFFGEGLVDDTWFTKHQSIGFKRSFRWCSASSWWYDTCIPTLWVLKLSGRQELTSHIPPMGRVTSPEPSNHWRFFFQLPLKGTNLQTHLEANVGGRFFPACSGCSERSFWTFSQSCTLACGPDPTGDHCLFVNACSYLAPFRSE